MASILRFDNWQNSDGTSIATTDASGNISFAGSLGAVAGVGKILQVVRATDGTDRSTTSTSFVDASISVTITPTKSTSAVILINTGVLYHISGSSNSRARLTITDSSNNEISGGRLRNAQVAVGSSGQQPIKGFVLIGYATPATTSATTYKLRFSVDTGTTATLYNSTETTGQMFAIEVGA